MHGVVFQKVGQCFVVGEVVDGNYFNVGVFDEVAESQATYAAEAVDGDAFFSHGIFKYVGLKYAFCECKSRKHKRNLVLSVARKRDEYCFFSIASAEPVIYLSAAGRRNSKLFDLVTRQYNTLFGKIMLKAMVLKKVETPLASSISSSVFQPKTVLEQVLFLSS